MRLGVLGGTFDPVHNAHLFIAEEARARCGLERVLFVPNAVSPFKTEAQVSSAVHRLEMTYRAVADNSAFEVSRIEIDRPGPSYTVDTLRALHDSQPGAEIYFITGADAVADIEAWREPDEVLRLARIVALTRPGFDLEAVAAGLGEQARARIEFVATLGIDLSATELRARVKAGLPLRYLAPDAVVEYVERNGLYR